MRSLQILSFIHYKLLYTVLEVASERSHNCKNIVKLIEQNKSIHSLPRSEGAIDQVNETSKFLWFPVYKL